LKGDKSGYFICVIPGADENSGKGLGRCGESGSGGIGVEIYFC
jgi:hypothetical protein